MTRQIAGKAFDVSLLEEQIVDARSVDDSVRQIANCRVDNDMMPGPPEDVTDNKLADNKCYCVEVELQLSLDNSLIIFTKLA